MRISSLIILFLLIFSNLVYCQEKKAIPKIEYPDAFPVITVSENIVIHDWENVFKKNEYKKLRKIILKFHRETTNEILVITIDSIRPYQDIQKFATDLGNYWGVGKNDKNNGLIIAFSRNLRKVGIATGLETEKILTDEICKKIIDQNMIPNFKKEKYFKGIKKGLKKLINNWD